MSTSTSFVRLLVLTCALAAIAPAVAAQTAPTDAELAIATAVAAQAEVVTDPPATLTYANRPIVQLRASIAGRTPAERVIAAQQLLDRTVAAGATGPIDTRQIGTLMMVDVAGQFVFLILPADLDPLTGETLTDTATLAASRLQSALNEVTELRRPQQLLLSGLEALLGSAVFIALLWALRKVHRAASRRIGDAAARGLQATRVGDPEFVRSARIIEFLDRIVSVLTVTLGLFVAFSWVTFTLRRFPYTRPWGESLRQFLLDQLSLAGLAILRALPGLFTVLLIVLLTRFMIRLLQRFFSAIDEERVALKWMYPETVAPTRKLLTTGLWLFAIVMAYPYLPGSDSDAFKGMSVFVGLVVSLGSSGIVNQVMSGFTLIYSRALRVGDFVAVGEIEGTVSDVGTLSTKIKTAKGEDVTIPNALVVSQTVTNYSRFANAEGVFVPATVTIGYDVPWRQVEALLLLAADRSAGVRRQPAPVVRQAALEDAYVRYTLLFCLEEPARRRLTLATVHANILDAFNEYGVQITAPNYEADPERPKIVPRDQWFAAPAAAPASASPDTTDALKIRT